MTAYRVVVEYPNGHSSVRVEAESVSAALRLRVDKMRVLDEESEFELEAGGKIEIQITLEANR